MLGSAVRLCPWVSPALTPTLGNDLEPSNPLLQAPVTVAQLHSEEGRFPTSSLSGWHQGVRISFTHCPLQRKPTPALLEGVWISTGCGGVVPSSPHIPHLTSKASPEPPPCTPNAQRTIVTECWTSVGVIFTVSYFRVCLWSFPQSSPSQEVGDWDPTVGPSSCIPTGSSLYLVLVRSHQVSVDLCKCSPWFPRNNMACFQPFISTLSKHRHALYRARSVEHLLRKHNSLLRKQSIHSCQHWWCTYLCCLSFLSLSADWFQDAEWLTDLELMEMVYRGGGKPKKEPSSRLAGPVWRMTPPSALWRCSLTPVLGFLPLFGRDKLSLSCMFCIFCL